MLKQVKFPVVAANINTDKEPNMKVDNLVKSVVLERNGVKIGIIGFLTPDTKFSSVANNIEYYDEVEAIK